MTPPTLDLDLAALRRLAETVLRLSAPGSMAGGSNAEDRAWLAFQRAATPDVCIALLDRLAAAEAELALYKQDDFPQILSDIGDEWKKRASLAEARLARCAEALRKIVEYDEYCSEGVARAALAECDGEKA